MTSIKENKRLRGLIESGVRCAKNDVDYSKLLKTIAKDLAVSNQDKQQTRFFKALGDQTRLRIIRLLNHQEMCVCEVMVALGLTQPTASHHLSILENANLVKRRKEGKWVFYSIQSPKLIQNLHNLKLL